MVIALNHQINILIFHRHVWQELDGVTLVRNVVKHTFYTLRSHLIGSTVNHVPVERLIDSPSIYAIRERCRKQTESLFRTVSNTHADAPILILRRFTCRDCNGIGLGTSSRRSPCDGGIAVGCASQGIYVIAFGCYTYCRFEVDNAHVVWIVTNEGPQPASFAVSIVVTLLIPFCYTRVAPFIVVVFWVFMQSIGVVHPVHGTVILSTQEHLSSCESATVAFASGCDVSIGIEHHEEPISLLCVTYTHTTVTAVRVIVVCGISGYLLRCTGDVAQFPLF